MEGYLPPDLRREIDLHLRNCSHCRALYDGARNIVRLVGDQQAIELPPDLSQRLYRKLLANF